MRRPCDYVTKDIFTWPRAVCWVDAQSDLVKIASRRSRSDAGVRHGLILAAMLRK